MSKQIAIGSRVKTLKGTEGIVIKILEGGYLLEDGKRVRTESIAMVIPPRPRSFKTGEREEYIGAKTRYSHQYEGIMTVWQLGEGCDRDKCACLRVGGRDVTSWIEYSDLQLVEVN